MPKFKTLDDLEFSNRLILSVEGERGSGKSAFGCSAVLCRPPVTLLRFDFASQGVLRTVKSLGLGNQVNVRDYDLIPVRDAAEDVLAVNPKEEKKREEAIRFSKSTAQALLDEFEADYAAALETKGTVVWETGSELSELVRIAELGRLKQVPPLFYSKVNKHMDHLINQAVFSSANLIMIHKVKDEWVDVGDNKSKKTGRVERVGYSGVEYASHAMVRLYREGTKSDPTRAPAKQVAQTAGDFYMHILKCNEKGDLVGTDHQIEDPMDGFNQLGTLIYGEDW